MTVEVDHQCANANNEKNKCNNTNESHKVYNYIRYNPNKIAQRSILTETNDFLGDGLYQKGDAGKISCHELIFTLI